MSPPLEPNELLCRVPRSAIGSFVREDGLFTTGDTHMQSTRSAAPSHIRVGVYNASVHFQVALTEHWVAFKGNLKKAFLKGL